MTEDEVVARKNGLLYEYYGFSCDVEEETSRCSDVHHWFLIDYDIDIELKKFFFIDSELLIEEGVFHLVFHDAVKQAGEL